MSTITLTKIACQDRHGNPHSIVLRQHSVGRGGVQYVVSVLDWRGRALAASHRMDCMVQALDALALDGNNALACGWRILSA